MFSNRIASAVPARPIVDPAPSPTAFFLFPPLDAQYAFQQSLYAWALAQAQAVVRPSLPERDLLGVWN